MDFRICILFIIIVLSYSETCYVEFHYEKCQNNMFCINLLELQDLNMLHGQRNMHYDAGIECSGLSMPDYSDYNIEPIYLVFTQQQNYNEPVPITSNYDDEYINIIKNFIYSLDLSSNNYVISPTVIDLPNLGILNISNNQLTTAVLSNTNPLNSLIEIDLSYNKINYIKFNSFEHPYTMLKKVNMSHNDLINIRDAVFDKIDDLQTLDLSHNYIEGLSQFTFEGTRSLLHLNLSNNKLSDINSSLFRFIKLKDLNLSGNKIKELKVSDFEKLNRLETLDLSSNFIKTIGINIFNNMLSLYSLDLSNNAIETASKDSLINLLSLTSIDLSRNKLNHLPKGLFKNKTIYIFYISENILEGPLTNGMFEGIKVTTLDLSNQLLTGIEDYAFNDLIRLNTLLLNNNAIQSLSQMCFRTLVSLQQLDLSNNKISSLNFSKIDLTDLQSLLLRNNRLMHIKSEYFHDLNSLEYLDLSENAISRLEPNSFEPLRNLINLQISDNPLMGTMETNTFDGLFSLPSLDISRTLLTTVQNASFNNMNELQELNMSRSKIKELQYNVFIHTCKIETLDLSFNKLETLFLNMTELAQLRTLMINNNLLKTISPTLLQGLIRLSKISLAYNSLENIHNESFSSLTDLSFLDLAYNEKFNFSVNLFRKCKNLNTLILSGIKTNIHLAHIEDTIISEVYISDAGIHNLSALNLNVLRLSTLVLSNNKVSKVEIGAFSSIGTLRNLDLSFNNITYIQPGAFKDNELLYSLNISHNSISAIGYGIFRGLIHLNTLDVSYNQIKDLQNQRFYEVNSLSELIVDHNEIGSVNAEEFVGTRLSKLSIGDNPLPCYVLIYLKKKGVPFEITAINKDEHSIDNIDGVTCNKFRHYEESTTIYKDNEKNDVLVDVRNILYNMSKKNTVQEYHNDGKYDDKYLENMTKLINEKNDVLVDVRNILYNMSKMNAVQEYHNDAKYDDKYLENITKSIEKANKNNKENLVNLVNLSSETNMLLKRILISLQNNSMITTTSVPFTLNRNFNSIENQTINSISYINKIKIELEKTIANEKQNMLNELEIKFSFIHNQTEALSTSPSNEKLVSTDSNNESTKSLFTETCVALILSILVGLVLYKFYKSRMFIRNRLSLSTRELPGAMENSAL